MPRLLMVATVAGTLRAFLAPIALHFRARGWRVDALAQGASSSEACVSAFDRVWDMPWSRSVLAPANLLYAPRHIRAVVEREGYELVHVHTPVAAFVARYALRRPRRNRLPQVIYTAHGFHFYSGGPPLENGIYLALEKLAGRWTDYLVVINREDEDAARRYRLVPPSRVRYMPGIGIDVERVRLGAVTAEEVARVRQELGLMADTPLFVMVAELSPRKRPADAIRALALATHQDAHLAFAGAGPLLPHLQHISHDLGLDGRVHLLGYRHDVPALMCAAAAVLLSSRQEGLPRSVMEAMALQVPTIATDIRGTRELLSGGHGLLTRVGDVAGLAQHMDWILDYPSEARALGQRGRERLKGYDLSTVLGLHESLYAEALEGA